jgi:hypothetical protein
MVHKLLDFMIIFYCNQKIGKNLYGIWSASGTDGRVERKPYMIRLSLLTPLLLAAGCSEGPFLTWEPETEAEREMRESVERLQSTVGEGAILGAAGGAALGALLGGAEGAFRGAEIGRLGGAAAGSYVRQLQSEFASEEAVLDQVIADLKATNARLEENIAAMRGLLAERRAALATARANADATRASERGRRNLGEMTKAVEEAERYDGFFGATRGLLIADGTNVAGSDFDPQVEELRNRIATMKEIASELSNELG